MQVFTGKICDFGRTADCPPPPAIGGFCKVLFILMFVLLLVYASVTHFLGTHLWLAIQKIFTQSSPGVNIFLASKTSSYRLQIGSDQFLLNIQTAIFGGMQLLEPKLRGDQQANQANPLDWGGVASLQACPLHACSQHTMPITCGSGRPNVWHRGWSGQGALHRERNFTMTCSFTPNHDLFVSIFIFLVEATYFAGFICCKCTNNLSMKKKKGSKIPRSLRIFVRKNRESTKNHQLQRIFFACTVAFSIPIAKLLSVEALWKGPSRVFILDREEDLFFLCFSKAGKSEFWRKWDFWKEEKGKIDLQTANHPFWEI